MFEKYRVTQEQRSRDSSDVLTTTSIDRILWRGSVYPSEAVIDSLVSDPANTPSVSYVESDTASTEHRVSVQTSSVLQIKKRCGPLYFSVLAPTFMPTGEIPVINGNDSCMETTL